MIYTYEMAKDYKLEQTEKRIKRDSKSIKMIRNLNRLKRFDPYLYGCVRSKLIDSVLLGFFVGTIFGVILTCILM